MKSILKRCGLFLIAFIVLSTSSMVFADDGTEETRPLERTHPSEVTKRVVVNEGTESLTCGVLKWTARIDLPGLVDSTSKSRDFNSPSYPCDIDKIGARARIWYSGVLAADTNMLTSSNSADQGANTHKVPNCPDSFARGNHIFEESGVSNWYPVSEDSC